jgi:hypothetical protein
MEGTITARTLDYFGLLVVLVAASLVALCSGVLASLCVKYELSGGLRGSGPHASLVLHWSVRTVCGSCSEEWP